MDHRVPVQVLRLLLCVLGVICGFLDQWCKTTAEDAEDAEVCFSQHDVRYQVVYSGAMV